LNDGHHPWRCRFAARREHRTRRVQRPQGKSAASTG
jgi:hypothetical protein